MIYTDSKSGDKYVKPLLKEPYNAVIDTLYDFAYNNSINQKIIYEAEEIFVTFTTAVVQLFVEAAKS